MKNRALRSFVTAAALVAGAGQAHASVFDLAADWSNVSNPNGPWSYNASGVPLTVLTTSWPGDPWAVPQPIWTNGSFLPVWFQSNGAEQFGHDWLAGDVITHTPSAGESDVRWTSPTSGYASITGGVWATRDIGRVNAWEIRLNGTLLSDGIIGSGDPYSRAFPFDLAAGSGGAAVLSGIPVGVGDILELRFIAAATGDYAGANLTITTSDTVVPEPSALSLLGLGLLNLVARRRSRTRA